MIKLDKSMLLGNAERDQTRGAKIGAKDMARPTEIVLEADKMLGQDERGQASGAKIGVVKV
jgi:hypothetical protein